MQPAATQIQSTVEYGCSGLRGSYSSIDAFNTYKSRALDTSGLSAYMNANLGNDIGSSTASSQQAVHDALTNLQTLESTANTMMKCIQSEINDRNAESSTLYTLQSNVATARKTLEDKKSIIDQAKERSSTLENPYEKTTVWEGWFPLGRPLKLESVPVLWSIAIFLLVISLGLFLRLSSIEFNLVLPVFKLRDFTGSLFSKNDYSR